MEPSEGRIVVRSGTTVALKCKASGNPDPDIEWKKKNDRIPATALVTDGGTTLQVRIRMCALFLRFIQTPFSYFFQMSQVGRHHSGVYQCVASNGVGKDVMREISLSVLCELF